MRNAKWPLAALAGLVLTLGGAAASAVAAPMYAGHHDHDHGYSVSYDDFGRDHGGWGHDSGWGDDHGDHGGYGGGGYGGGYGGGHGGGGYGGGGHGR
ncbi:hypothetical protein [Streptomyces sp. NPDC020362]|uniref:hypothetical protein n=1 Tax=unclassified Streptomyces TaxID=2593676 RepID=UPI0033D30381